MMSLLNLSEMVVLNGIQAKEAQFTCKAARGEGIDDYVAVSCGLVERMSEIEYWKNDESDHVAIACKLNMKKEKKTEEENEEKKKICFKIVDDNCHGSFGEAFEGYVMKEWKKS